MASVCTSSRHLHCREKKLAAKAQGRRHASSDEDDSEDEAATEGGEGGGDGEQDPFFQHEDNPFDDPFFRVKSHFSSVDVDCSPLSFQSLDGEVIYDLSDSQATEHSNLISNGMLCWELWKSHQTSWCAFSWNISCRLCRSPCSG